MAEVYPIIFSYLSKHPKKVERDYKNFFFSLCQSLEINTSLNEIHMSEFTIPALLDLPQESSAEKFDAELAKYSESLAETVHKKLIKNNVIEAIADGDCGFRTDSPHIILCFQATIAVPPKSLINLFQYLRKLIAHTANKEQLDKKIIIVLPTAALPSKKEFTYSDNIQEECEDGQVILFDQTGHSIISKFHQKEAFETLSTINNEQTIRLLEAKLIGRIGHFQREHVENGKFVKSCHLYFYDGDKCIDEVAELLKQKIADKFSHIVYHCPQSPWLKSALENLKLQSKLSFSISNSVDEKSLDVLSSLEAGTNLLFVVDLVHTGKTLSEEFAKIKKLNANLTIHCCSILYSGDIQANENKQVTIGSQPVEFFLRVKQQTFQQGGCEMCKTYKIPFYNPNGTDPYVRLQSYFYWKLSETYGYLLNAENDPPSYRPPLPIVPDFKRLLIDSGAYVASKIIQYFDESHDLSAAHMYTFICPDEEGANLIGRSLENLKDISVIAIPNHIIELVKERKFNKNEITEQYKKQEWLRALVHFETESANKSVVIFDEFTYTGEKLRLLADLVREFNLQVVCYFPFILYQHKLRSLQNESVHSLYSFDLQLSKPA